MEKNHAWTIVIVMGTMSSVAGGVIREVLRRPPTVAHTVAFITGMVTVVAIRLLVLAFHWQLPVFASS